MLKISYFNYLTDKLEPFSLLTNGNFYSLFTKKYNNFDITFSNLLDGVIFVFDLLTLTSSYSI